VSYLIKVLLTILVSSIIILIWNSELIPTNPDQTWYIETAKTISDELTIGHSPDYNDIIVLHNRSYNIILGWLTYLNGGIISIFSFRLLNCLFSMGIAIIGFYMSRKLYPEESLLHCYTLIILLFLPSINVYSMFVLRDILIAFIVIVFFYGIITNNPIWIIVSMIAGYYTRAQILLVMAAVIVIHLLITKKIFQKEKFSIIKLIVAIILGVGIAVLMIAYIFPSYAYMLTMLESKNLVKLLSQFIISLFSLDFLFVDLSGPNVLSRESLTLSRIIMFDSILLPFLLLLMFIRHKKYFRKYPALQISGFDLIITMLFYFAGYWTEYGLTFLRLFLPFYPIMLVLVTPIIRDIFGKGFKELIIK